MKIFLKPIWALLLLISAFSCIPIKKQLLLTDKSKKTLKQRQQMDTVLSVLPFEYKIKKGDILAVNITSITPGEYRLDQAARSGGEATGVEVGYVVNDSGIVDVPVIGQVKVGGLNIEDARNKLKGVASEFLNNVTVNVKLLNFEVTVLGEIGPRVIKSPNGRLTVIEAVSIAGGPTRFANLEKVKIIRQSEKQDKVHVFYVDISDVGLIHRNEYFLRPNDIVVIEPNRAKNAESVRYVITFVTTIVSATVLFYSFFITVKGR